MWRSVTRTLLGVALLMVTISAVAWSWPYVSTARALYLFEQESPTEVLAGSAQQGAALGGLDVVTFPDGRVLEVYRQGEPRRQWPRSDYVVGEHGARLADEPATQGVWRLFAYRAAAALLVALIAAGAGARLVLRNRSAVPALASKLGFTIFGQRAPDAEPVWWVSGGGGHGGGGGQVPPLVPHNPDWDTDRRIP